MPWAAPAARGDPPAYADLQAAGLLDPGPEGEWEPRFDGLAALACHVGGVSMSAVCLAAPGGGGVCGDGEGGVACLKAARGLGGDPEARAAVLERALALATDAAAAKDGSVWGIPFFVSVPIVLPGTDTVVGALCVLDGHPRPGPLGSGARAALELLARQAAEHVAASLRVAGVRQETVQFVAKVVHELRTPLNGVAGVAELLRLHSWGPSGSTGDDGVLAEYFATLQDSAALGLHIVGEVLDFAKLENGRVQLEAVPFSLRSSLEAVLSILRPSGRASAVEVGYQLLVDAGDVEVTGDPHKLRQVLLNLLSNALRFTPSGSVVATVRLAAPTSPTGAPPGLTELQFEVRDTGIGISPEQAPKLFAPFAQADASTSRLYGGTGLGLVIARSLVEAMGGTLTFRSVPGQGTTFAFSVVAPVALRLRPPTFSGRRLLVVEPCQLRGNLLAHHCNALDIEVERFASLEAAEGAIEGEAGERAFDALLCASYLLDPEPPDRLFGIPVLPVGPDSLPTADTGWVPAYALGDTGVGTPRSDRRALPSAGEVQPLPVPVLCGALERRLRALWGIAAAAGDAEARRRGSSTVRTRPLGLRVVLADDNAINQRVLAGFLRRLGCAVDVVGDGRQAVEQCAGQPYDVAMLDLEMPVLGGLGAAQALRDSPVCPIIIGVSGHAAPGTRALCRDAGMVDLLTKPIRFEDIARVLQSVAAQRATSAGRHSRRSNSSGSSGERSLATARRRRGSCTSETTSPTNAQHAPAPPLLSLGSIRIGRGSSPPIRNDTSPSELLSTSPGAAPHFLAGLSSRRKSVDSPCKRGVYSPSFPQSPGHPGLPPPPSPSHRRAPAPLPFVPHGGGLAPVRSTGDLDALEDLDDAGHLEPAPPKCLPSPSHRRRFGKGLITLFPLNRQAPQLTVAGGSIPVPVAPPRGGGPDTVTPSPRKTAPHPPPPTPASAPTPTPPTRPWLDGRVGLFKGRHPVERTRTQPNLLLLPAAAAATPALPLPPSPPSPETRYLSG